MRGMHQPARVLFVALAIFASGSLFASRAAFADAECPPGSTWKSEGTFKWCEPTVCDSDAQCSAGQVCRPFALCMQVGSVDAKSDAGQRLIVTQQCGPDKSCPSSTTCSDRNRCLDRAVAERIGVLTPAAANSASAGSSAPPAKSSCGCSMPGLSGSDLSGLLLAGVGIVGAGVRRRARRSKDRS